MRKSFLTYTDIRSQLHLLTDDEAGVLFKAIVDYACDGTEIQDTASTAVRIMFTQAKERMDNNAEKYEETCRKRAEAIRKRWESKQHTNEYKSIQKNTNVYNSIQKYTDNDNDNDNDNENDNGIISTNVDNDNNNNKTIFTDSTSSDTSNDAGQLKGIIVFFNATLSECHSAISPIKVIQGTRAKLTKARIKEYGIDVFKDALQRAAKSTFLNGGGTHNFIATYDWIIRPNNFPKIIEGNYSDKTEQKAKVMSMAGLGEGEYRNAQGQRTYGDGSIIVPDDAPRRPCGNDSYWSRESKTWITGI